MGSDVLLTAEQGSAGRILEEMASSSRRCTGQGTEEDSLPLRLLLLQPSISTMLVTTISCSRLEHTVTLPEQDGGGRRMCDATSFV
jgi:hypothetical protein